MSNNLMDPEEILAILEQLEKSNDQYKGITYSTRQYIFADPLMPIHFGNAAVGNKLAFELFKIKNKEGFYVSMDANNFKLINNISHETGDNAIKSIGYALRYATIGLTRTKLFRTGGDEFVFFTENSNEVDLFVKKAIGEINNIELIGNSIKLTISFGIGKTYLEAETALLEAKKKKTQVPNLIHSLL